jgi:hypothetical protein
VLADFANSTGDAIFDDTLKTALSISLRQSPFLALLPEGRARTTLQQMTRPPDTKLTPEVARELCQRTGTISRSTGCAAEVGIDGRTPGIAVLAFSLSRTKGKLMCFSIRRSRWFSGT